MDSIVYILEELNLLAALQVFILTMVVMTLAFMFIKK